MYGTVRGNKLPKKFDLPPYPLSAACARQSFRYLSEKAYWCKPYASTKQTRGQWGNPIAVQPKPTWKVQKNFCENRRQPTMGVV